MLLNISEMLWFYLFQQGWFRQQTKPQRSTGEKKLDRKNGEKKM